MMIEKCLLALLATPKGDQNSRQEVADYVAFTLMLHETPGSDKNSRLETAMIEDMLLMLRTTPESDKTSRLEAALTVAMLLALPKNLTSPPTRPPIIFKEKAIKDALRILKSKPEWEKDCREDIETGVTLVQHRDLFFVARSKPENIALAQLLAALKRARDAKEKLPWFEKSFFEMACDLEAGIAFCQRDENEQKQIPLQKPLGPPSRRQVQAVQMAWYLVNVWLVRRQGIHAVGGHAVHALSRHSAWHELSAILFGEKIDLITHMSRYKQKTVGR